MNIRMTYIDLKRANILRKTKWHWVEDPRPPEIISTRKRATPIACLP